MSRKCRINIFLMTVFLILCLSVTIEVLAEKQKSQKKISIGERFHKESSLSWGGVMADLLSPKPKRPDQYKNYPQAKSIKLPRKKLRKMAVEEAIEKRRSIRNYSGKKMSMTQLAQLLFAASGVTEENFDQLFRSAPSAGALYPIEIYIVVNNVESLPAGIYHYGVRNHELELLKPGDFRSKIISAGLKQDMLGQSNVTFILSAIFDRVRYKYGERGFRYAYIEAGHIAQNISLQAVSLGLGSVSVGAFIDKEVNQLIGVDGLVEAAIYLHAVGAL